jgi:hypothetical protein
VFQIAHALVFDLGLNKPVRDNDSADMLPDSFKVPPEHNPRESRRTIDERRTYLACYFSTSVYVIAYYLLPSLASTNYSSFSLHIRKSEIMQHTPYLDFSCKVLQENQEYPSDAVLAALVRLQCIAESFQRNLVHNYEGPSENMRAPTWMYIEGMRSQLQQFWMSLSPALRSNS